MMNIEDVMNPKDTYDELLSDLQEHAKACPAAALAVELMHAMEYVLSKNDTLEDIGDAYLLLDLIGPVNELAHEAVELRRKVDAEFSGESAPVGTLLN